MMNVLLLLTSLVTIQSNNDQTGLVVQSPQNDQSNFQHILTYFNSQDYSSIYNMLSSQAQVKTNSKDFSHTLSQLYQQSGTIETYVYTGYSNGIVTYIISYSKTMQTSSISWTYDGSQLGSLTAPTPQNISMYSFFKSHPKTTSMTVFQDNQKVVSYNEQSIRPMTNQIRLLVVIEYARQVSMNIIQSNTTVNLNEVKKFYIKNNDLLFDTFVYYATSQGLLVNNKISIKTLVYGMVVYSINANTEYLETFLGIINIQNTIHKMQIRQGQPIYHVSSQLMFTNFMGLSQQDYMKFINGMTPKLFRSTQLQVHALLVKGKSMDTFVTAYTDLQNPLVTAILVKWLVSSTSIQQATLMNMINKGQFRQKDSINQQMSGIIYQLLGSVLNNSPQYQLLFQKVGINTGSFNVIQDQNAILASQGFSVLTQPTSSFKNFSYAFMIQGLSMDQLGSLYVQLDIFLTMILSNSQFNLEFHGRLRGRQ